MKSKSLKNVYQLTLNAHWPRHIGQGIQDLGVRFSAAHWNDLLRTVNLHVNSDNYMYYIIYNIHLPILGNKLKNQWLPLNIFDSQIFLFSSSSSFVTFLLNTMHLKTKATILTYTVGSTYWVTVWTDNTKLPIFINSQSLTEGFNPTQGTVFVNFPCVMPDDFTCQVRASGCEKGYSRGNRSVPKKIEQFIS